MKVIELANNLKGTDNKKIVRIDRDTTLSEKSWECSLISCGAVIEAVDSIMKGDV